MPLTTRHRPAFRRISLAGVAAMTAGALLAGISPATAAPAVVTGSAQQPLPKAETKGKAPALTQEQRAYIEEEMGPEALAEISRAMSRNSGGGPQVRAFPIAAVAIGAAAWCARGAVASVPTSVLSDIADGKVSSKGTYARNAIIGCLGGEIGGLAWKVLPGWVKNKAVAMVAAFIIKYVR